MHLNSSAPTPKPPYYAVIFTPNRTQTDEGYGEMANKMVPLARAQPGYLGAESFRNEDGFGVTISYWQTLEDIKKWKTALGTPGGPAKRKRNVVRPLQTPYMQGRTRL